MARLQYTTVREEDLGAGIDQQSAENRIAPGFSEDIENADPKSTGQISKRTGYQGYAGYVPVRARGVEYDGTDLTFFLDTSISLPLNQSSPIIVLGKTSVASGDFASETAKYYEGFTADVRRTFFAGTDTVVVPSTESGLESKFLFVGVSESNSLINNSNQQIQPDQIRVNQTTFEVSVDHTNSTGSDYQGFVYTTDKSAVTGTTYVQESNTVNPGSNTFSIPEGVHALDNNNIIVHVYEDVGPGSEYRRIYPDAIKLDDATNDVEITINNNGPGFTAMFILTAAPTANFSTGSVASGTTETVVIDTSGPEGADFAFISCYLEPETGTLLEEVLPDSIVTDSVAQTITITFTNNFTSGATFEIYWDFASIATNKLTVTADVSASFNDSQPQLTIWGLCHEEIYGTREAREGWVNHIDSYRAPAENRLIAGLGGNLFAARLQEEAGNEATYLMPTLYPRLNGRLLDDTVIGPAFYDTGETPARTRGYVTADNGASNFFEIESIAYHAGSGYVDYTLNAPNLAILDSTGAPTSIGSVISTALALEDEFTAQQCGYSQHNGTFTIKAVSQPTSTTIVIRVENSLITTSDYDEADVGGLGGIFTDQLRLNAASPFLSGDLLDSDIFSEINQYEAASGLNDIVVSRNVIAPVSLPGGLRVVGTRTSSVIPVRSAANAATVENLVRGDMLNYTNINRQFRIKSINPLSDTNITIVSDGSVATVTLLSGDTSSLFVGKKVLIEGTMSYNGVHAVSGISGANQFTIDTEQTTGESGIIVGKTIEIDENFAFSDTTNSAVSISVDSRWIPIESPLDNFDLTPKTRVSYFDTNAYGQQAIIRSTMVQDNLYLTNDDDEVMKFDGANLYRAGLFRWQPGLFVSTDTASSGKIVMDNPSISLSSAKIANQFIVSGGDEKSFSAGDIIQDSTDDAFYTVTSTETSGRVVVDKTISGGTSGQTIARTKTFLYYFRLNAVDANDNVVASAVTGSEDFAVRLGVDASVTLKLLGLPAFDTYDYDRLEVEIYRTQGDSVAPYYRLTTLALPFNASDGYIEYTDTDSDEDLINLDETVTAIKGSELATAITQPLRAKYCTTAGNRLILGNLKDYPTLDIRLLRTSGPLTPATFHTAAGSQNKLWQFRKDNLDTSTGTDMINRARYEFTDTTRTVAGTTVDNVGDFQVTTTAAHGLVAGDWVYLFHSALANGNNLSHAGWWQINEINSPTQFTILQDSANLFGASTIDRVAIASASGDIPVFAGTDGNSAQINGAETTASFEFLAMKRLANAINASMRKVDTSLPDYGAFSPWMTASAGNEFQFGQLVIRQPRIFPTTLELQLDNLTGDFDVFVNNVKRGALSQVSSLTRLYPSRIIASYQNFPEIFDNPNAVVDTESDSVIDINSADGQEITAIIPFFGDAAFGAAQKSSIIVVFKTNSIYLVDLSAKDAGQNAVQRLETRGKGCTAPFSVSVTRGGIMFANDTGIYRLGRDLKVEYLGRKYERKWKETVNKRALTFATGHHDTEANNYKLSYPLAGSAENSEVAVYNHTREYEQKGDGSWTTYTNHPATGWANLEADSYFCSTDGRVYIIRKLGEVSDYRDDDQAIPMTITTRAMDMRASGVRKVFSKIITHYRTVAESKGTTLEAAMDLKTVFQNTDDFVIRESADDSGIGDTGTRKVVTIASVVDEKVGIYIQLRYKNATLDEPVEISGIDIRVAAKSSEGITEAAGTTG